MNARDWRKHVGVLAQQHKETTRTYTFPLDTTGSAIDFDAALQAYNAVEGVGYGSLLGLACAVHLSGFRLFSTGKEAATFRNRARYPNAAFQAALRKELGTTITTLTPETLDRLFSSRPKRRNGVPLPWNQDSIRDRLYTNWVKPRPGDTPDAVLFQIATGIAQEITEDVSSWTDLAKNSDRGLKAAHRYFARVGGFPAFDNLTPPATVQPTDTTIDYDPNAPFHLVSHADQTLIHQSISLCAHRIRQEDPALDPNKSGFIKQLQNNFLSQTFYGLSWLFGAGYVHFRECTANDLAIQYGIPNNCRDGIHQIKSFADAILPNTFFEKKHYRKDSRSVGKKAKSWISNYWQRLLQLQTWVDDHTWVTLPQELTEAQFKPLFRGLLVDAVELMAIAERLPQRLADCRDSLDCLMGKGPQAATKNDVEIVEKVREEIESFVGQIEQLGNQLRHQLENENNDQVHRDNLHQLKNRLPLDLRRPQALNKISGGVPDVAKSIRGLETQLDQVLKERRSHFGRLTKWAKECGITLDPLQPLIESEKQRVAERGSAHDAKELAIRLLLQRIGRLGHRLSPTNATAIQELLRPVFAVKREFNLFFHNHMGALYRSPYSTSRHQPFQINVDVAHGTDWIGTIETLIQNLFTQIQDDALLRDLVQLEGFVFSHKLRALPGVIPSELARPNNLQQMGLPALLLVLLQADQVHRETVLRVFNLYGSAINGYLFQALRPGFIVRAGFQRLETKKLRYVPKAQSWQYPDRLHHAKSAIKNSLSAGWIKKNHQGAILPQKTLTALVKQKSLKDTGVPEYLVQAPHDWYVPIDLRGPAIPIEGLTVGTEGPELTQLGPMKDDCAFRAIGPSSFKSKIDAGLLPQDVKYGDMTLIFDQHYQQSISFANGTFSIQYQPTSLQVKAAIPVVDKRPRDTRNNSHLYDRIVAIDLGERKIGYAIFDLKQVLKSEQLEPMREDGKPLIGSISIRSIRGLMKAVQTHRNRRQPNYRIDQTYSKALMHYRESVIGDVCNAIDTLCARYGGFPVLESSVRNFEVGSAQLKTVYGSVSRRYTWSAVDAHKNQRQQYWLGGTKDKIPIWTHPYLMTREWDEKNSKWSNRSKPLKMHPGVEVHPAGTSQICHQCKRNPIGALWNVADTVVLDDQGQLDLDDGTIRLNSGYIDTTEIKRARRKKIRLPENKPLTGSHKTSHVRAVARRNLRQPPKSTRAKDTTQSRYTCLYVDCGHECHADENAAINIGRKYLQERIHIEASRQALSTR
tara:strand:- start:1378 stop:5154 length:3777 start_codon:yes stop_codon:yes gene_type:complete